jgi:hypothetical protein
MTIIRAKHVDAEEGMASSLITEVNTPQFSKTPSWFTQLPSEVPSASRESDQKTAPHPYVETPNVEAYEAYKKRLEQRFQEGQDMYDRPTTSAKAPMKGLTQRRPTLPLHEIQGRKKRYELEQKNRKTTAAKTQTTALPWMKILALGSAAICIGAVAGFGFSNAELVKQKYAGLLVATQEKIKTWSASTSNYVPTAAVASNQSVIVKKPISTATLDVSDVRGTLGGMIPLALSAQSADASEPISLKISGLPDQAYLTAGVKSLEGNWTLKSSEIGEVNLVVPRSDVKQFDMEVSAVDDLTGALAAPTKAIKVELQNALPQAAEIPLTKAGDGKVNSEIAASVIPPAAIVSPVSAVPETAVEQSNAPSAIPKAINEADDLVSKGNALLDSGDIIAARQFFTRAAELGNAQGSFGVARTYDPKVFAKLNVVGLQPDEKLAAGWYKKAADAGVVASTQ